MHIQVCYWLQEDSLAVLACLSVCCPGLQGHPSGVQTLWAKQLTNVRWQHDVHTALGAHMLPSQTQKHIAKFSSFGTLELINFSQYAVLLLSIFFTHLSATCRSDRWHWRSAPCACGAAGNDLPSRTSLSWPSHCSLCEGSPQSAAPVHPHPSFYFLHFSPLPFHLPPSLPQ